MLELSTWCASTKQEHLSSPSCSRGSPVFQPELLSRYNARIHLPIRADEKQGLPHTSEVPASVASARPSRGGSMSIVLAEDNPTHCRFARQLLDQHFPDYGPVLEVADGATALQRALTARP